MPKHLLPAQIEGFERDGFVAPVRVISAERALHYRRCLEAFEAAYPDQRLKLDQKAHVICPWVDEMIREPAILDTTEDLIGPDILCCGTSLPAHPAPRLRGRDGYGNLDVDPRPQREMGTEGRAAWQRAVESQASVLFRGAQRPPRALAGMTSGRPPGGD